MTKPEAHPDYDALWHLVALGILTPDHAPNGWQVAPDAPRPTRVAVIDTSVAADHPNLRPAINRDLALDLGVRMQIGFGAFPSGVPHTRPVSVSATASSDDLAASLGFVRGTIDVPAGVEAVIERRFSEADVPAVGVWAQVPHYAATMRYPAASARLIEVLNQLAGTDFDLGDLPSEIAEIRDRIDTLIADNPEHVAMLRQLEQQADESTQAQITDLPSGDDLAEELQQFLREQGD